MGLWLSYSGWSQYNKCPKRYKLQRVDKQDPPVKESKHNAVVGTVIQEVFEAFYNKEIWRRGAGTSEKLHQLAELYLTKVLRKEYIDYEAPFSRFHCPEDFEVEIRDLIPKILSGIKRETLLGPYSKSEMEIQVRFGPDDFLVGYLDFVIRTQESEILILDGKASKHREKYVDMDQLRFYALLFYIKYRVLPDRLGIFYYAFGDDPEKAFDWLDVVPHEIKKIRESIESTLWNIRAKKFDATPSPPYCKYCPWQEVCPERIAQKTENSAKRSKPLPPVVNGIIGFAGPDK